MSLFTKKFIYTISISLFLCSNLLANEEHIEVGIDEKLGTYLSGDLIFKNSEGVQVKLSEVITKPTLLAFVYYECPGICNTTLTELAWVVDRVDLVPEEDFQVLTISIDHEENAEIAAVKKVDYLNSLQRRFPNTAWTFLVGDSNTVNKITSEAGFYFKKIGDEYRHAGSLISISPERKISRYIFGTQYNQFDVKMALLDAKAGKTNPTVAKLLQFCFSYDPEGRSYSLNITRIVGSAMLLGVGIFFSILVFKKKKKN